jgi:hypothetical protein
MQKSTGFSKIKSPIAYLGQQMVNKLYKIPLYFRIYPYSTLKLNKSIITVAYKIQICPNSS